MAIDLNSYSASRDNWCTVGGDGGCRVGEVRASITSLMPNHKGFKLQLLVNFQKFSTLRVNSAGWFSVEPSNHHLSLSYADGILIVLVCVLRFHQVQADKCIGNHQSDYPFELCLVSNLMIVNGERASEITFITPSFSLRLLSPNWKSLKEIFVINTKHVIYLAQFYSSMYSYLISDKMWRNLPRQCSTSAAFSLPTGISGPIQLMNLHEITTIHSIRHRGFHLF